ncbi:MAG: single-stranded-DNA-specific exonuclease RecJ [Gammaproteobacteria bacterium]|nr:single-stranded-DNA-specific exonuclease RecJ [Gammaproteobacteria bacterium]MBV8307605.1 single-stranded-DNA-specific exonuclease RecJ [Gammaproteobacteria bacterium]MBV8405749.1 single-stranded-DNA-specific exonuclease RecJ [Gammaproteobacteria bacterium]
MTLRIVRRSAPAAFPSSGRLHPVLERVYAARGVCSEAQLDHSLLRLLPVGTLEGIEPAVQLLLAHRLRRVLVVGDFDADGATSCALVVRALRSCGFASVEFLVPNRFEFGYGLTPEIVALAAARSPSLIVTVDNGISSNAGVAAARERGIEVLITDHHLPGARLPDANVIVNPNLAGSRFASRSLAGVGVAFYIMAAVRRALDAAAHTRSATPGVAELLDLVALGTVADVVPLDANNRVLVAQGLRRIRAGRCVPGIRALLAISGRTAADLTAADLAFAVAPRLNAAGRIDDMTIGVQCLLAEDAATAQQLALRLDALNEERRAIEARMQQEALGAVRQLEGSVAQAVQRSGVCLFDDSWHQGVVGLVASRVKERVRRPVIAFAVADDATLRGSARSIEGVHIRDVLDSIAAHFPGLIHRFGGHAMAAGLTLERARLDEFARAFDAEVARCLPGAGARDTVETDGELAVEEIALTTAEALRAGGPWGQAFPEPSFDGLFSVRSARLIGERHVKMWVEPPSSGRSFDAIAFNHLEADRPFVPPEGPLQLVYRLEVNEYQGERRLQLLVDHLLPPRPPPQTTR